MSDAIVGGPGPVGVAAPAMPPGPPDPDAPTHGPTFSYMPGLDGVRAFAVLSVMAYHGGIPWLTGGFLGVDTFFVLSGFLITGLLISEWQKSATIRLGSFWARRARRLLPALLLMLLFVALYAGVIVPRGSYPALRLDALSSLFYVANWHFILVGSDYFNQTGLVSPLTHTWSLAIEEQFYLVWPLVVLGVLHFTRNLKVLLGVCVAGAAASAIEMAVLYRAGADLTRLDFGTDTHAQCLFIGAALAVTLALVAQHRRATGFSPSRVQLRRALGGDPWWAASDRAVPWLAAVGAAGAAGTAVLWWRLNGNTPFLYQGGFAVAGACTAAVLASVVCLQSGLLARALSVAPLRYLGRISYGMYLWHFPLFIWLDHQRTGLEGYSLFAVRAAVTVAVATASFYLVERPIRQGTFFRDWRGWVVTPVAAVGVVAALLVATTAPALALGDVTTTGNPSLYSGPPVRVLFLGDSTALTLGLGLSVSVISKAYDVDEYNEGILGCGVAEGTQVRLKGTVDQVAAPCRTSTPVSEQWPADWAGWISQYRPNVVVYLGGRWEVADRVFDGQWTSILNPAFAAYVKQQLQEAVDVATAQGSRVVLLTAPCYDSGEQPDGQPWPEDNPARVQAYNRLVKEVAAANPTRASLVDLYSAVCPGGVYSADLGGVPVRASDGVHFTVAAGEYLASVVWPPVVAAGRAQMAASRPTTTTTVPAG